MMRLMVVSLKDWPQASDEDQASGKVMIIAIELCNTGKIVTHCTGDLEAEDGSADQHLL